MVSGLGVFDAQATGITGVLRTEHDDRRRRLLITGTIAECRAFAVPHHTGSIPPIDPADWDRVAGWIREEVRATRVEANAS
jgi:hypothetical protein